MANHFSFSEAQFNGLFPFYILINRDLNVVSIGKSLGKLCDLQKGKNFNEFFSIPRPLTIINSLDDLIVLQNQMVLIELNSPKKLMLRGQFEFMEGTKEILFLGSPWFGSMEQLRENNLQINDFAKNDPLIDLLHVLKTVEITNDDLKELIATVNKQKNDLKKANKEVYDIALFPKQNPDPNIRINYEGDLMQNNPAASNLDFIEYEGSTYRNDMFFKLISSKIDKTLKRWNFEARSNEIDYSFDCVAMPEEGYINIYGRDITEQKINQQELEKLSLIVQETTSSVVITDSFGKIEWVNKAFEKITGYNLLDAKGNSPGKLLQGEKTDKKRADYMRQKVKNLEPFTCEVYNYKKSGEGYWGRINAQPIFDKKGEVINFFALKEDITGEKLAKEKLRKAASRMSSLITNLQDAILLENENQTIELVNERFCNLFKIPVSPNQLIGADCSKAAEQSKHLFANPELFVSGINEILKNKKLVIGNQLELANGRILERNFIPIWNGGKYDGHLWVYSDITEKITANKKLEELRVFYEKILDNIPSDIAVFDKDHHYLYVNPKGIRDVELRKWIIGKTDEDYIKKRNKHVSIIEERKNAFREVLESKQLKSWEEEMNGVDGTSTYIMRNMYPVVNSDNEVDLVIGYGVDITSIKLYQQQLEESKIKYKEIVDNSLAMISTHDIHGFFLTMNPIVEKLLGYHPDDVIGHHLTEFMHIDDREKFEDLYLNLILSNKEFTGTFRVINKEGKIVYCLLNNYLKEMPNKEPYVIAFAIDITKRIEAERELKKAKEITERLALSKQNFLANMSHEIRTPMNAIMGMSRQLLKSNINTEQKNYLDIITNSSENLLVIINDVLDLAKLEAGKLSIENIPFSPKLVMENVLKSMMHKAEEKGLTLSNTFCDSDLAPILMGDPFRLNQILLNLISNALKFTTIGGVDVSCRVLKDEEIFQEIEIIITDTGIGMDGAYLKNLFQKFSQEYASTARKFGGTGLGMSITKTLIDNMGGEIWVKSTKGKGTAIGFKLTMNKGVLEEELKISNKDEILKIIKGKKILVVDDNVMNRMVATLILKEYEAVISEVENGKEAINHLINNDCDLVLLDLQMPILNGYSTSKIIRKKLKMNLPIVALTANVIKGEREKCLKLGMDDYLSKPFEEDEFVDKVAFWIEKSKNINSAS
ncbi:PAS domain S-box protein [Lutibacter sp.]|uniref:PAS domain S-box protein n=1 Tax=Lutibacter sp. TaxID=1925666 RepID=UPI001A21210E|nr:PAS domain S-box protein [Lutibacter sp.]MBI9039878.1 PAS domain S-box protein [Lutibacter sp.]